MTFVGNHDVTRVASVLDDPRHVEHALVLLLTTGGVPSIYAGDEWAYRGVKEERFGGDDAVRPEFAAHPSDDEPLGQDVFRLHQYLIGLRRRNPWLHEARTSALHLTNRHYVYRTQAGDNALVVALNVDDTSLRVSLSELGIGSGRLVAGSGAPAEATVDEVEVAPHGWAIVAP
jgi:glycosidase